MQVDPVFQPQLADGEQLALGGERARLRLEHDEVDADAVPVAALREPARRRQLFGRAGQVPLLRAEMALGGERRLHLGVGVEHPPYVMGERFALLGIGALDTRAQLAALEERLGQLAVPPLAVKVSRG